MRRVLGVLISFAILSSCSTDSFQKGDLSSEISLSSSKRKDQFTYSKGQSKQGKSIKTQPGKVLFTGHAELLLVPIYMTNFAETKEKNLIGATQFYREYPEDYHGQKDAPFKHFMPGIEAAHGLNMLNVHLYNLESKQGKDIFESATLINTIYYPSERIDSLKGKAVERDYLMVSLYDEDTNQDSLINKRDLRRLFVFDLKGEKALPLVPLNYSVLKSQYDPKNDFMHIFAQKDENGNGKKDRGEPVHIFWVDLANPKQGKRFY